MSTKDNKKNKKPAAPVVGVAEVDEETARHMEALGFATPVPVSEAPDYVREAIEGLKKRDVVAESNDDKAVRIIEEELAPYIVLRQPFPLNWAQHVVNRLNQENLIDHEWEDKS